MSEPPPFMGVLSQCANGHREINTAQAFENEHTGNPARICARCRLPLRLVRKAMIVPGRSLSEVLTSHLEEAG